MENGLREPVASVVPVVPVPLHTKIRRQVELNTGLALVA
jgi:hypothetical protein